MLSCFLEPGETIRFYFALVLKTLLENFSGIIGFFLANFGFENGYQAPHLSLGQPDIKPDVEMRLQLGVDAFHAGQSRNGGNLPALEIQVVAPEDVSEQVAFQKLIYGGSEGIDCPGDRPSCQACLNFRSKFDAAFVGRQGACFFANFVLDALLLSVLP